MLLFGWVNGAQTEGIPEEIPLLLADLENADAEHHEVDIEQLGDIGIGVDADFNVTIEDLEGDRLAPHYFRAPDEATIIEIARLLEADRIEEIMSQYPWQKGYPWKHPSQRTKNY